MNWLPTTSPSLGGSGSSRSGGARYTTIASAPGLLRSSASTGLASAGNRIPGVVVPSSRWQTMARPRDVFVVALLVRVAGSGAVGGPKRPADHRLKVDEPVVMVTASW